MIQPPEPDNALRVTPFRWAVGALCVFFGALMLVEPHQFGAPVYRSIQPQLQIWGAGFLAAGLALLCVVVLVPRTVVSIGVHTIAGGVLLYLASQFAAGGAWTAVAAYGVIGLGTAASAILPVVDPRGTWSRGDLLALVTATSGTVMGMLMLLVPGQFGAATYDPIRSDLALYGAAFVVSCLGLIAVEIRPIRGKTIPRIVHLLAGGMFVVFMLKVAWPTPTGVALYGGFGLAVVLQSWLARRLPAIDTSSLRTRSALMLVAVAGVALIGAVAVVTDQAGQFARKQALAQQQTLAVALAANADDYIRLHRAAAAALASTTGLLDSTTNAQQRALRDFKAAYPDVLAFVLFDVDGTPVVRSDDLPLPSTTTTLAVYEDARRTNAPSLEIRSSSVIKRPIFAFGAPIRNSDGQFAGMIGESIESSRVAERTTLASGESGMTAYLVDARGRAIAHPNAELVESFADLGETPPVAAFLASQMPSGVMTYSNTGGEQLVGYASLPDLGWGVIVERPTVIALEGLRVARELAFALLLSFLGIAGVLAVFSTRWLTRPLALLAAAARRHSIGDISAPLPASQLTEIAQLASAFRQMRADVVGRTAERDQAGLELQESEARLRQLMDAVPVGIYVMQADGEPYYANTAALRLLGRGIVSDARVDALSEVYQAYLGNSDALYPMAKMPIVRALAGESAMVDDLEICRPDGTRIPLDVRASPIFDELGLVEFAMSTFADISERKLAEEALRVSEERFRRQYKGFPLPTYSWLRVSDDFVMQDFNDAAAAIAEGDVGQWIGARASERYVGQPEILSDLQACVLEQRTIGRELHFRYQVSGRERELAMTYVFVPPLTVMLHSEDITEAKQAEKHREAVAQSDKLRALGQMAIGIAHDLNQSLMLVASYSELARQALVQDPPNLAELEDLMTTATQAALDGGDSVRRLLQFTRAAPDEENELLDLGNIVRGAAQLTAPRWRDAAQREGRSISLHVEVEGHPTVQGSPSRLRELMTNLIFNAVDALPTGGTIRLRVVVEDGQGVIEIADSGLGMSAEVQQRIFEPFFTTKGEGGTGLGLAMVFGIVEQHLGHITVRSEGGKGTTFRISLPIVESSADGMQSPAPLALQVPARPLRILAVDDEPMMTKAVVRMLRPSGHLVSVAASGEEAVQKLTDEAFDVVVSDVGMGAGMSGLELADEVKLRWPGVRFLLATGWGAAIDAGEARARGVEAILNKPYHPGDLNRALARTDAAA